MNGSLQHYWVEADDLTLSQLRLLLLLRKKRKGNGSVVLFCSWWWLLAFNTQVFHTKTAQSPSSLFPSYPDPKKVECTFPEVHTESLWHLSCRCCSISPIAGESKGSSTLPWSWEFQIPGNSHFQVSHGDHRAGNPWRQQWQTEPLRWERAPRSLSPIFGTQDQLPAQDQLHFRVHFKELWFLPL